MNREGARKVLTVLRAAYPNTYRNMSKQEASNVITVYTTVFADIPEEVVVEALMEYIKTETGSPTPGGLYRFVTGLSGEKDYEAMFKELWAAICGNKKFDGLCPANQRYIGSQKQIDILGQSEDTLMDVERGLYMRRIPTIVREIGFEEKLTNRLGADRVRSIKDILRSHPRTDELPEVKISRLVQNEK